MDSSVQNRPESENPHHHHRAEQQNEINHNNHKKTKLNTSDVSTAPLLPSAASSPSHEFSFTISLHHHSTAAITTTSSLLPGPAASVLDKNISAANKTLTNPFAIDLSPADEIFFHGHLLPLHLLSHLQQTATSPRSSTNSLDSFTLPIKELMLDEQKHQPPHEEQEIRLPRQSSRVAASSKSDSKIARKSKSFSRFGWRKVVSEVRGRKEASADAVGNPPEANTSKNKSKKKQSKRNMVLDDVSQLLKRYIRMVRPLLFFKKNANREENRGGEVDGDGDVELDFSGQQQHRSFSGNLSARRTNKNDFHVRSGRGASELFSSAPASMRTSPSNSGVLVPTPMAAGSMRNNDSSTMEELQAAIQAAIAHCKNSIAAAEEGKAVVKA
ncbi:hypothetical protein SAY87_021576 [Trapa incisa]|uniref:BRI1 kinase inhibitor 1 n=1 Tax=Trapa incisa TaxID=236973 RepID=A0AAN7PS72_9MYRT|nr:hypothetical protein SAY87_021576 [Trapa incisa]